MTVSTTLQNLNMTFSHFLCPAGMIVILADQNIIFISNMNHKLFLDFEKTFCCFSLVGIALTSRKSVNEKLFCVVHIVCFFLAAAFWHIAKSISNSKKEALAITIR